MKRIATSLLACTAVLALVAGSAFAAPNPNGANVKTRIFNDCPLSSITVTNTFPSDVAIDETWICASGFANLHNWSFSDDGGATAAVFNNGDAFMMCADVTISGNSNGEAGLRLSPWFSKDVDGRFNIRTPDGEIACFGGRLPFYTFTGNYGLHYVKGTTIHMEMWYRPNGLSMFSPATIEYKLTYNAISYTSGQIAFDEGNPGEDPPYGLWGDLNDSRVGGYFQPRIDLGTQLKADFANICYSSAPTAAQNSTWGRLKSLYR